MKTRILLLVSVLFLSFSSYSMDSTDSLIYMDAKQLLSTTAVNGGDVAKKGYDVVVGQQKVKAILNVFVGLGVLISFGFGIYFYRLTTQDRPNTLLPAILFLTIGIIALFPFCNNFYIMLTGFVNPDYAAIEDIVKIAKTSMGK